MLTKQIGDRFRELIDQAVFRGDALAVVMDVESGMVGPEASASGVASGTSETRIETCCAG
jgi:hypothetical protein